MKKFMIIAAFIFAALSTQAQKPITKMDSTRASVTVQPQNYTYSNVYVVITNINYGAGMYMTMPQVDAADSINISATATLYASKAAFESGSQSLTSVQINTRIPNTGTLPDHWAIKQKLYTKF